MANVREVQVVPALQRLRDAIAAGDDDDVLVSSRLNTAVARVSFVQLIDVVLAGSRSA
jgi:hypothetical protein